MNRNSWIIICLAYIIGLFFTSLFYFSVNPISGTDIFQIGLLLLSLGIVAKFIDRSNHNNKIYLSAVVIAILAVVYFYLRIPQPQQNDISNFVTVEESQIVMVRGKVLSEPRLNSNNKLKFWLKATELQIKGNPNFQVVAGKLYTTVPLLQGNNLVPNQFISIEGSLYKPKIPNNSTQFNFAKYLKERGAFAGLTAWKIVDRSEARWGWYRLRKRIVRAQVKGLGSPLGQLVSSMVLGRRAVDLPEDIRNLFIKSGLAHVLAASGFHISLLLGIILRLTNFLDEKKQLIFGSVCLLIYIFLTGFSPSVIRASLMGIALMFAIANKAKVRPLGSLLLVATILLLINPLWIWDLGFQLSFLATLGIIITLPVLVQKSDWLPVNIANAISVPLAASIWVLPLISYVFNTVATYSVVVNLIAMPLITIISLGGMLSSAISLIVPLLGSYLAWLLKYPILLLITITNFFTNLPGSNIAIGSIPLWLLLIIYSLIVLTWLNRKFQKYWLFSVLFIVGAIVIPLQYQQHNLLQITILDTSDRPAIIIQDRDRVIAINSTESQAIKYTIIPFLTRQGINQIDYLVTNRPQVKSNFLFLQSQLPAKKIVVYGDSDLEDLTDRINIPVELNSIIKTNSVVINPLDNSNALQITINNNRWLLADRFSDFQQSQFQEHDVLLWLDKQLNIETINRFNPQIAISRSLAPSDLAQALKFSSITLNRSQGVYTTDRDGTITWTPQTGFTTATDKAKRNNNL